MTTFLLKTEPSDYSFDDLLKDKRTPWDGVSSPAGNMHMRSAKKGDEAFIYHTASERRIVGLARIVTDPYEDPDRPGTTAKGDTKYPLFEVKPLKRVPTIVTLDEIKADTRFKDFALLRESRLSVMPVPDKLDAALRKMCGL